MGNKVWITSDTHFFHKRIIEYENRPYVDEEVMTEQLIKNWNSCVKKNDLVYHLGDVGMGRPFDKIKEVLFRLNGNIILVAGNHDESWLKKYRECGRFKFVTGNKHKLIVNDYVILSHEPIFLEDRSPFINLFGHVHGNPNYQTISRAGACVCVERWNYKPVDFDWLVKEVASKTEW